jgi:hypothetical protein
LGGAGALGKAAASRRTPKVLDGLFNGFQVEALGLINPN